MKIFNPLPRCLLAFFFFQTALSAQDFYDLGTIQEIKLTFSQSNWDALLDNLKQTDEEAFFTAAAVEINGQVFDSVGVKYKGNSSYNASNQKNPLHIELDHIRKSADYQGYTDVKLGNGFADATFVREALSYEIVRQYMVAPRSNFAKLFVNGTYWGLYSNTESITKTFIKDNFYTDGDNPFFKCTPVGGVNPGSGALPDLVYSTADSNSYKTRYELKSAHGWRPLLALMDTLKNRPDGLEKVLDVDRALWMLAFNAVLVNLDSYTGAFAQNYYLYQDENGRWLPMVWDLNMSFGGFPILSSGGGGGFLSTAQMQNLDPLVQSTNAGRPLIRKLLANAVWKRQYLAHMRTILAENFADTGYRDRAVALQAVIDDAVQADAKKFFTYQQFKDNVDIAVSGGVFGSTPGLKQLMQARNTYLTGNALLSATAPEFSDRATAPAAPQPGEPVWVTAKIANATAAWLGHRAKTWQIFQKTPLLDDGQHHDGTAGDGTYGASFPADAVENQYFLYAENASAGRFSPERAEFEFHSLRTDYAVAAPGEIVLNELLAANENGSTDEFNQHEDWLEIFNRTQKTLDLRGLRLTDDPAQPDKWAFPRGSVVLPGGYLIVWLDEDGGQGLGHANFKISAGGEFLMLSDSTGAVFDSTTFGPQTADRTFGRYPNGSGPFTAMPPTFSAQNSLSTGLADAPGQSAAALRLFPNPAGDFLQIISPGHSIGQILVTDALGRTVLQADASRQTAFRLSTGGLPPGIYRLKTPGFPAGTFFKK